MKPSICRLCKQPYYGEYSGHECEDTSAQKKDPCGDTNPPLTCKSANQKAQPQYITKNHGTQSVERAYRDWFNK